MAVVSVLLATLISSDTRSPSRTGDGADSPSIQTSGPLGEDKGSTSSGTPFAAASLPAHSALPRFSFPSDSSTIRRAVSEGSIDSPSRIASSRSL